MDQFYNIYKKVTIIINRLNVSYTNTFTYCIKQISYYLDGIKIWCAIDSFTNGKDFEYSWSSIHLINDFISSVAIEHDFQLPFFCVCKFNYFQTKKKIKIGLSQFAAG